LEESLLPLNIVRWKLLRLVAWTLLAPLLAVPNVAPSIAAEKAFTEYDTKALFIVNVLKYTEWPPTAFATPESPYVIGILGRNPFGRSFKTYEGKKINGRPLDVKEFDSVEEAKKEAHILFVAGNEKGRFAEIVEELGDAPVLTLSDGEGFIDKGGVIGIALESKRIVFSVNQTAVNRAKLGLSSEVFKLARQVKK
jgi:hypothetical protein